MFIALSFQLSEVHYWHYNAQFKFMIKSILKDYTVVEYWNIKWSFAQKSIKIGQQSGKEELGLERGGGREE